MIYIVEYPGGARAHAWFAFDTEDLARKLAVADGRPEAAIHSEISVRELLAAVGEAPETPSVPARFPALRALGELHGWDTTLYRADDLLGEGVLRPEPVSEAEALTAAIARRAGRCRIFWSDTEATAALEGDPEFQTREGYWGREALREQLVALEILEGPNG